MFRTLWRKHFLSHVTIVVIPFMMTKLSIPKAVLKIFRSIVLTEKKRIFGLTEAQKMFEQTPV